MSSLQIHIWNHCHHCGAKPIAGTRFHCETCPDGPDNDLCEACYALFRAGKADHPPKIGLHVLPTSGEHRFTSWPGNPVSNYDAWFDAPMADAPAPAVRDGLLVRPEFCSGYESSFGGYAFAVQTERGPVVLTALHVMDEMIKKKNIDTQASNKAYSGRELPGVITKVNLYDVLQDKWMLHMMGEAGPMLTLPNARTGDEEPYSARDIAAFWANNVPGLCPGTLAENPPRLGEPVWLAVKLERGERTLRAVVVEQSEQALVFRYADSAEGPKYTSGAPILDREGRIVGINVGGGYCKDTRFGHANHVKNIRRHLAEGLKA